MDNHYHDLPSPLPLSNGHPMDLTITINNLRRKSGQKIISSSLGNILKVYILNLARAVGSLAG